MRLVQITIPAGQRQATFEVLDAQGIDYVVTDETSDREYVGIAYFPLPTNAVEDVLGELREAGLDDQAHTVVLDAETVISRRFEELQSRYEESGHDSERIAREELEVRAKELAAGTRTFVVMTVISAIIATAGLLLDSPAVVVGSMVIAPLIGPAMATAVGTVVDEPGLFVRGTKFQVLGLALSIASAAAFALVLKSTLLIPPGIDITAIPQIRERLAPDFLSLAVALGAGVAGVVSLSTGVSSALVGVMIAVALIPPAATVGIGIAWGYPMVVMGSGVLLLVNVLSINLAAIVVLWYAGYRPTHWFQLERTRGLILKRTAVLVVAIVVLSVFLGGVTYDTFRNAAVEQEIRTDVEGVFDDPAYDQVSLLSVQVEQTQGAVFRDPRLVVVTVGVPPGATAPDLAGRIDVRVDEAAGRDVSVQVRYVEIDQREADSADAPPPFPFPQWFSIAPGRAPTGPPLS